MTTQAPATPSSGDPAAPAVATPPVVAAPPVAATPPAAPAATPGKAPEKYEAFKLPEGVQFAPELQQGIEEFSRANNLGQDAAQGLADFTAKQIQGLNAKAQAQRDAWRDAATKDPEVGGDKLEPALAAGAKVLDTFANAEFRAYLNTSGLGSHPEMIRAFARIAGAISPDKFVPSGGTPPPPKDSRTLYPNSGMNP